MQLFVKLIYLNFMSQFSFSSDVIVAELINDTLQEK